MKDEAGRGVEHAREYVDRVRCETQRYAHQLLAENERLLRMVASVDDERRRMEERSALVDRLDRENRTLQERVTSAEQEKLHLEQQLQSLRDERQRHAREQSRLHQEMRTIEERGRQFAQQYLDFERLNSNLAHLYVASYRLHGTLDRREVLDSIQEILTNLVGSEQTAIFEMADAGRRLELVRSNGIDPRRYRSVEVGHGPIGRTAATGRTFLAGPGGVAERSAEEPDVTACIPLRLDVRVIGVIAVFRLLPQKPGLEDLDHELFELLATHAATALYCASLHDRFGTAQTSAT